MDIMNTHVSNHIFDHMPEIIYDKFMELPEKIGHMYLGISEYFLDDLYTRDLVTQKNEDSFHRLIAFVIGINIYSEETDITKAMTGAIAGTPQEIQQLAQELKTKFIPAQKEYKKIERKRKAAEKKKREEAKKKLAKQSKEAKKNAKKLAKLAIEKEQKRTRNTFCKNSIEFITQEDIEDIPTKDLTFIKLDKAIFCLDKDSFKNMIKFAKGQRVRGSCKPVADDQPLDCKWFYPINIGQNVYISEDNYKKIKLDKRKFSLKNKRVVDFTTGLHIMSEKSGKDNVYDLVPENFSIEKVKKTIKKKVVKKKEEVKKIIKSIGKLKLNVKKMSGGKKSMTVKELKAECKKKGIKGYSKMKKAELEKKMNQKKGRKPLKKRKNPLKRKSRK